MFQCQEIERERSCGRNTRILVSINMLAVLQGKSLNRKITSGKELFEMLEALDWKLSIYSSSDTDHTPTDSFLLINDDLEEDRDKYDEPSFPASIGYKYLISVSQAQDVKAHAEMKNTDLSDSVFFEAVRYYVKNDAYM